MGKGGTFAVCTSGLSCCGEGTFTPECYLEEYNECCHPEGAEFSVVCAKGQGCASTDNGVPFCVDQFEACRFCESSHKDISYLCHPYSSDMCFPSPDPKSCREAYGQDATFCYGVYANAPDWHEPTNSSNEGAITFI